MTTLNGSLPGTPFCGCDTADDVPPPPQALEVPSDDVLESLHQEGIRQGRNRLLLASLGAVVSAGVVAVEGFTPFGVLCVAGMAVTSLGAFGNAVIDWRRLRRSSARDSWLYEQRHTW
jgi:hypothetical protein